MAYGPLRVYRKPGVYGDLTAEQKIKDYWEKLSRLAPAEVTGFYLTFRPMVIGSLAPDQVPRDTLAPWWPWICVGLVVLVRVWATHGATWRNVQWKAVAIATVAFILWVITMGHYMAYLSDWTLLRDPRISGILAAVFTFVVPHFYSGDPPPAPVPAVAQ
jgi:hypothetical protein